MPIDLVIRDSEETIKLSDKKRRIVGEVKVPKGAFKKGTILKVKPFDGPKPKKEDDDDGCKDDKKEKEEKESKPVSTTIDLTAYSRDGKMVQPKKGIAVSLVTVLPDGVHPSEVCFGFNQDKAKWQCEKDNIEDDKIPGKKNTYEIRRKFDHFTGFSVLLGSTSSKGGCGSWGVLQWLSMTFLIGAGVLFLLVVGIYHYWKTREYNKLEGVLHQMATDSVRK